MRDLLPSDVPAVVDLVVRAGLFGPDDVKDVTHSLAEHFSSGTGAGNSYLVEAVGDVVVAVAHWQPKPATDRVWDLTMIAVAPDRQDSGLGSQLLAEVELRLRASGQRLLVVETSSTDDFKQARSFYRRNGYLQSAEVPDYWEDGDGLIVFSKRLT